MCNDGTGFAKAYCMDATQTKQGDTMENVTIKNNWAETRNTSTEIADAINEISGTTRTMEQIWDEPTDAEFRNVVARADEIACHEAEFFNWGGSTITVHVDADPTCFSDRYDF